MMIKTKQIGITGGIGSGKSTVAREFEKLGVPVYYSDDEAKRLMVTDDYIIESIITLFGEESYIDGKLNTEFLSKIVFNDKELLSIMNDVVHPIVMEDFKKWSELQNAPYVLVESAILIETGLYKNLDSLLLITCDQDIRIKRVMERNSISEERVKAKMNNQMLDKDREEYADYIITNNSDMESVIFQVKELNSKLI